MGSLCHEVAKLQADRAQLEELLAQVLHPLLLICITCVLCTIEL